MDTIYEVKCSEMELKNIQYRDFLANKAKHILVASLVHFFFRERGKNRREKKSLKMFILMCTQNIYSHKKNYLNGKYFFTYLSILFKKVRKTFLWTDSDLVVSAAPWQLSPVVHWFWGDLVLWGISKENFWSILTYPRARGTTTLSDLVNVASPSGIKEIYGNNLVTRGHTKKFILSKLSLFLTNKHSSLSFYFGALCSHTKLYPLFDFI